MGDLIAEFITWILSVFIALFGDLLMFLVKQLIKIATYNSFVVSTAVVNGWVIVRDLCNIFFIVILLMIAIATILKIEMYHYKKLLGRLIIMAILINFSKTIAGIIIDFAQVLTLTFVNGFKAAAGGNFVQALGLDQIMKLEAGQEINAWKIAGAYALALIMIVVSCIVVGIMMVVFLIRIVMLWILIVLSPLAFFLTTFPQGQKYASQWWSQFGNYVIVGPVMAFFLWLSLISVSTLSETDIPPSLPGETGETMTRVSVTKIGGEDRMQAFIIAIGMLVGSLVITQQMGIMGSSLAGAAVSGMKRAGMAPAKWAGRRLKQGAVRAGERVGGFISAKTGGIVELRPSARAKRRDERHAAKMQKREGERQVRAGALAERAPLVAGLINSKALPGVGRLTQIAAGFGRKKSQEKVRLAAGKLRAAGYADLRGSDPIAALDREDKTEARIDRKKAKRANRKAKKLQNKISAENAGLIAEQAAGANRIASLEGEIKRVTDELGQIDTEQKDFEELRARYSDVTPENIEEEIRRYESLPAPLTSEQEKRLSDLKKMQVTADFRIVGVDAELEKIRRKREELRAEYESEETTPRRRAEIDEEQRGLEQRESAFQSERATLAQNTFDARRASLNQRRDQLMGQLRRENEDQQIRQEQLAALFSPVREAQKLEEKYNKSAIQHEANLSMNVEMKVERVKEKLQEDKQNLQARMWRFLQEEGRKRGKSDAEMMAEFEKMVGGQMAKAAKSAAEGESKK